MPSDEEVKEAIELIRGRIHVLETRNQELEAQLIDKEKEIREGLWRMLDMLGALSTARAFLSSTTVYYGTKEDEAKRKVAIAAVETFFKEEILPAEPEPKKVTLPVIS